MSSAPWMRAHSTFVNRLVRGEIRGLNTPGYLISHRPESAHT
jgi:hypothetical protein